MKEGKTEEIHSSFLGSVLWVGSNIFLPQSIGKAYSIGVKILEKNT